jgi:serine/threonine protein kinase
LASAAAKTAQAWASFTYIVRDIATEKTEAAKTFQHSLKDLEGLRRAIQQEAELWIELGKHPNIVQARHVETMGDQLYIFMEYVAPDQQGRNSLRQYLDDGPLPEEQFLAWAIQACRGMAHAHAKGLGCHRDIKPDNLLISASGDLKITDFGLAKAYANAAGAETAFPATGIFTSIGLEAPGLTCTGLLVGTPGYIAPEIVLGKSGDIRSDIYSFGLVFYQMLTGQHRPPLTAGWKGDLIAYERETLELRQTREFPSLTSKFDEVVAKCLRFSPNDRFQDFTELLAELQSLSRTTIFLTDKADLAEPAASPLAQPEAMTIEELIDRATALINLGRLEEALECILRAKKLDPNNPAAWNSEGTILTDWGRCDEALRCFDRSIELDPTWVFPWHNKGCVLRKMGRSADALVCFENALKHDRRHVPPWVSKGNSLCDLDRYLEALSCYEQAIRIDENWVDAWMGKGRSLVKLGRLPEARASFERVLELDPQNQFTQAEYRRLTES